ncbi:MAG: hypothetical protein EAZ84_05035 [Verrucomicrobia bacterium]|nr:MAG: hypothetical protein EAZ84_05035 [Verrucomicrobiota bacterium]TAE88667.1 MAG: hypothetical protein EAZ82_02870 [Verrucomicrobiota bacterium]TAF26469.1 MAG: hypothetical protein EAZ71_04395 [Verrucomicrobiota bacterium]
MKAACCLLPVLFLVSCAQMDRIKTATTQGFSKVGEASKASVARWMPASIPVVEVREDDLQLRPSGEEQALAFEKNRHSGFWSFFEGPVDFEEPTLPDEASALDGELLPPRME